MRRRQIQQEYTEKKLKEEQEEFIQRIPPKSRVKQRPGYMTCPWCEKQFREHGLKVHITSVHIKGKKRVR